MRCEAGQGFQEDCVMPTWPKVLGQCMFGVPSTMVAEPIL